MTPKEKAIELYESFYYITPQTVSTEKQDKLAKDCALKCVNELINVLFNLPTIPFNIDQTDYFRKVKEELNNL